MMAWVAGVLWAGVASAVPYEVAHQTRVVDAGGVEHVQEIPAAGVRLGRREQHVGVVLDGLGHAFRQGGGEFAAARRVQLVEGDAVGEVRMEGHRLADVVEVRPAEVDVELRFAHALDRLDGQLPREHGDDAGEFRQGAFAPAGMEAAADADGHRSVDQCSPLVRRMPARRLPCFCGPPRGNISCR